MDGPNDLPAPRESSFAELAQYGSAFCRRTRAGELRTSSASQLNVDSIGWRSGRRRTWWHVHGMSSASTERRARQRDARAWPLASRERQPCGERRRLATRPARRVQGSSTSALYRRRFAERVLRTTGRSSPNGYRSTREIRLRKSAGGIVAPGTTSPQSTCQPLYTDVRFRVKCGRAAGLSGQCRVQPPAGRRGAEITPRHP